MTTYDFEGEWTNCAVPFCPAKVKGIYGWYLCRRHWPCVTTAQKKRLSAAARIERKTGNSISYVLTIRRIVFDLIIAEAFGLIPERRRKKR